MARPGGACPQRSLTARDCSPWPFARPGGPRRSNPPPLVLPGGTIVRPGTQLSPAGLEMPPPAFFPKRSGGGRYSETGGMKSSEWVRRRFSALSRRLLVSTSMVPSLLAPALAGAGGSTASLASMRLLMRSLHPGVWQPVLDPSHLGHPAVVPYSLVSRVVTFVRRAASAGSAATAGSGALSTRHLMRCLHAAVWPLLVDPSHLGHPAVAPYSLVSRGVTYRAHPGRGPERPRHPVAFSAVSGERSCACLLGEGVGNSSPSSEVPSRGTTAGTAAAASLSAFSFCPRFWSSRCWFPPAPPRNMNFHTLRILPPLSPPFQSLCFISLPLSGNSAHKSLRAFLAATSRG
mmetsp:Transcript_120174/g.326125  ORF Transcript_120174/g.326125 Transcript_120174/m.326125 type:complete len:347 (+) Transcript_120174:166-1206(+)